MPGFPDEVVATGLDGLQERLAAYAASGLKFAKWRAVIRIGKAMPSQACIESNAHALARYAADCQAAGLVPVVEPEVLLEGGHSIERCAEVMASTFDTLFAQIDLLHVDHQALILKTSMALSGSQAPEQASVKQVAQTTIDVLTKHVPYDLAGIVFLSGGQSLEQATEHLAAITSLGKQPWPITFSFARALQSAAMHAWAGKAENVALAQQLFVEAVRRNSRALPH